MAKSKISWTERTWNPVTGCTKISSGCKNCYAEKMSKRIQAIGLEKYKDGFKLSLHPDLLDDPLKIKHPSMFFVCSMGDLFHEDVPYCFIDKVVETIRKTPHHTYQLLTKRAERMQDYFSTRDIPQNVWIGVTVENSAYSERIDCLRNVKCSNIKFLSIEPMLGTFTTLNLEGIGWVIVGGESGNNARPMKKDWLLTVKRHCEIQKVPFFFKQWGTYGEDGVKRNKKENGCKLDGKIYQEFPNFF